MLSIRLNPIHFSLSECSDRGIISRRLHTALLRLASYHNVNFNTLYDVCCWSTNARDYSSFTRFGPTTVKELALFMKENGVTLNYFSERQDVITLRS
jgi:hypothetical protein